MKRVECEMEKRFESWLTQEMSLTWVLARPRSATQSPRTSHSASCNGAAHGTVWVERSPSECCRPFAALCHSCSHCTGCTPGLLSLEGQDEADWERSQPYILNEFTKGMTASTGIDWKG